jgi:subtilisin-like proprotein convertase family protein
VHHKFYFGKINVEKLVSAALTWKTVLPQHIHATPEQHPEVQLTTATALIGSVEFTATDISIVALEHVQLSVSYTTTLRGSMVVELVCGSGTSSQLLGARPRDKHSGTFQWTFMTTRCWDERCVHVFVRVYVIMYICILE